MRRRGGSGRFWTIWAGQLVSIAGSGLTLFGLSTWVLQKTGSTTLFALMTLVATLPGIVVAPWAGAVADRHNRRTIMLLADAGAALPVLAVAVLMMLDRLELWHVYVAVGASAACGGVQVPAYMALAGQITSKEQYARVSGLMQMSRGAQYIVSPIVAGSLLHVVGVHGILIADVVTYAAAIATLLATPVPSPALTAEEASAGTIRQLKDAWAHLKQRPGLVWLVGVIAAANLMVGFLMVLVGPIILSFSTPAVLGVTTSVAATGMVVGSVAMATLPPPRDMVRTLLAYLAVAGLSIAVVGLRPDVLVIAAGSLLFFLVMPLVAGQQETLLRRKTVNRMHGRVFALNRAVVTGMSTVAFLVAGPLTDYVFEPLMRPDGRWATTVGLVLGTGRGRGAALVLSTAGVAIVVVAIAAHLVGPLRRLEAEVKDVDGVVEGGADHGAAGREPGATEEVNDAA